MPAILGYSIPVSVSRRIVDDFLHLSMTVPTVAIQKEMNVAEVMRARSSLSIRPSWMTIFTKAFAIVVNRHTEFRRVFLTFPWQRMYEYTRTTADIVVEVMHNGEPTLLTVAWKRPEQEPLLALDQRLVETKANPVEREARFRRAVFLAKFPRFVRRWVWWYLLSTSGPRRDRAFGTFGVTSVGNWGVDSLRPLAPWTSLLHFGAIDADGRVTMRLTFDHRVLDGSLPSKALVEMEQVLHAEILDEIKKLSEAAPMLKAG